MSQHTAAKPTAERSGTATGRLSTWSLALGPLVLLALVLWGIFTIPPSWLRGGEIPPIEKLSITQVTLPEKGRIEMTVVNGGPDPVTIAQVLVDEAYWDFTVASGGEKAGTIPPLGRAEVVIPYNWVHGEDHEVSVITERGMTFSEEISPAVQSPSPSLPYFGLFAMLGVLVGVIPVFLGLGWYPLMQRLGPRGTQAVLCFTVGLLVFLFVESVVKAVETTERIPSVYNGTALIVFGLGGSLLLLTAAGQWLRGVVRRSRPEAEGLALAVMVAVAVGLHNMGEGLAIGAAFNLGAISLGTALIAGFTIHNITEGLAIIAPLGRARVTVLHLVVLGLIAGVPTVFGGWIGAFTYSPIWSVLFLALGAGAIAQVVVDVGRQMARTSGWHAIATAPANLGGLVAGYVFMYATSLFAS